jgi:GNAT superfamily N-acetyltransferase
MSRPITIRPEHFAQAEREKGVAALARFTLSSVPSAEHPDFDAAYRLLAAEFGARGELERREVLAEWLTRRLAPPEAPCYIQYFMIIVRDQGGEIAGVRDCYVTNAPEDVDRCVVYLAHVLVAPAYRRSGVASLLRAAPIALAELTTLSRGGLPSLWDIILAGEMEPLQPESADSFVRLVAYGRSGFWAISPKDLPYCQPDFRDLEVLQVPPKPIPLLAVIRYVGKEGNREVPRWVAEAFVRRLYGVFSRSCRPQDLGPAFAHSLAALPATETLSLLPLPRHAEDHERVLPLLRDKVVLHFPESLGWNSQ